jgi:Ca-activated chloride channel homolog
MTGLFRFLVLGYSGLLLLCFTTQTLFGQGFLVPDRPGVEHRLPRPFRPDTPSTSVWSYKIKSLRIQSKIEKQVAQTEVSQTFTNTGSGQIEARFIFPLPYDGAIDRMTFLVDGKEYTAQLMDADKARNIFEEHVRKSQDPALLEWVGHGMFQSSVFPIPPGASRTVSLRYSQLLTKQDRLTNYIFPLATAKFTSVPLEEIAVRIAIACDDEIRNILSPSHPIETERSDSKHCVVSFKAQNFLPSADFRLMFDTASDPIGASVVSYWPSDLDDGYFLLLASPHLKTGNTDDTRKALTLVMDRSGSMAGEKFAQAQKAAKYVMEHLAENDMFNIIVYDSGVESFRSELQKSTQESRQQAIAFIDGLFTGGGTNIDGALQKALECVPDASIPSYIVFMTDGLPTEGITDEAQIAKNVRDHNSRRARVLTMGVGDDVNSRLLDRLSRENHGQTVYVRPQENLEAYVSDLYNKIALPVMSDVQFSFSIDGNKLGTSEVNRMYPAGACDLFAGQQLAVLGRYRKSGRAVLTVAGKVKGEEQSKAHAIELEAKGSSETNAFIARLWAIRRIGELIDQLDLNGKNDELVTELVSLAKKHGLITPYTSFLADETAPLASVRNMQEMESFAAESLQALDQVAGPGAFEQRRFKQAAKSGFDPSSQADVLNNVNQPIVSGSGGGGLGGAVRREGGGMLAGPPGGGYYGPGAGPPGRGRMGGYGFSGGGRAGPPDADEYSDKAYVGMQSVKDRTLLIRGDVVFADGATDVDLEKQANEIVHVKRFTDAYFQLVKDNTEQENAILASQSAETKLIIRLRGKIYQIE